MPASGVIFEVPRRVALAVGGILFFAILLVGLGAVTPGAISCVTTENGPAVLVSWLIDSAIDAATVALWLAAAIGIGHRLGGRWTRGVDPLLRVATAAALGLGAIGLAVLALGLIGRLNRITGWAIIALGLALLPWQRANAIVLWVRGRSRGAAVAWLLAVPAGVMAVATAVPPVVLWKPLDPHPYDVVSYHLQIPREWFEIGRIVPLPHNAFSYFPMGQETHDLLLMHLLGGPWAAMYACQMISAVLVLLTALAVVGTLRTLGIGPVVAWLAGLLAACVPWSLMLGSVAYVEAGVMPYSTLAVAWALLPLPVRRGRAGVFFGDELARHSANPLPEYRETEPETALVLAGVCCGLAGGVKYTALAMTAVPVFVLWPIFAWPVLGRRVMRSWLVGGLACLLCVSPWLIRNVVWTGDPVFPLATGVFGRGPFTDGQVDRYARAHAPPAAERSVVARVSAGWHRVVVDPQAAYGLVPLTLLAMAGLARSPGGRFASAVLLATAGVWLLATHDMPRFLAPAIPLAAMLVGVAAGRFRPFARLGAAAMLGVSGFGVAWTLATLGPTLDTGRAGLFRLRDLTPLESPEIKAAREAGGKLALVGDAQAFFYAFGPGRLKYRGVFDVVIPPGTSLVDGWLGEPVDRLRAEGWTVLIAPAELARLSATYAGLPKPTPPYDDPAAPPLILPPTGKE